MTPQPLPAPAPTPKLGIVALTTLLVSAHYGLGFLLGTGEQTMVSGLAGSLYPLCLAGGTFLLLLALGRFYWQRQEQIWTLLGDRYGQGIRVGVGLLSWMSLIGIGSVQIIGGAATLSVIGLPKIPVMVGLTLAFVAIAQLPTEKASWVVRGLLFFNIGVLIYGLISLHGLPLYGRSAGHFIQDLHYNSTGYTLGILLSTLLLVQIDMKYQQYFVQAQDVKTLYWGCGLAGVILMLLAFLPSNLVLAAQQAQILPPGLDAKAVIPQILLSLGGHYPALGFLFVMGLVVPALGIGSGILRVQSKTVFDLGLVNQTPLMAWVVPGVNGTLALAIALKGGSIIGLIASFYAAYGSAVWVPFGAYLVQEGLGFALSKTAVYCALGLGSSGSFSVLFWTLWHPQGILWDSPELTILAAGLGCGLLGLGLGEAIDRYRLSLPQTEGP